MKIDLRPTLDRAKVWATECRDCGRILTPTEQEYYEYRCERCEREWFERVEAWRSGGEDEEIEAWFAQP